MYSAFGNVAIFCITRLVVPDRMRIRLLLLVHVLHGVLQVFLLVSIAFLILLLSSWLSLNNVQFFVLLHPEVLPPVLLPPSPTSQISPLYW